MTYNHGVCLHFKSTILAFVDTDDGHGDTGNAAKKFYWHDACSILRVDHIFCAENTLCALVAWAEVVVKLPGNSLSHNDNSSSNSRSSSSSSNVITKCDDNIIAALTLKLVVIPVISNTTSGSPLL